MNRPGHVAILVAAALLTPFISGAWANPKAPEWPESRSSELSRLRGRLATATDEESLEILFALGRLHVEEENHPAAISFFTQFLENSWRLRGAETALTLSEKILEWFSREPVETEVIAQIHLVRASALQTVGRVGDAVAALEDLRPRLDPKRGIVAADRLADTSERLGTLYLIQKRHQDARQAFEIASAVDCGAQRDCRGRRAWLKVKAADALLGFATGDVVLDGYRAALVEVVGSFGPESVEAARVNCDIAMAYLALEKEAKAAEHFETVRRTLETAPDPLPLLATAPILVLAERTSGDKLLESNLRLLDRLVTVLQVRENLTRKSLIEAQRMRVGILRSLSRPDAARVAQVELDRLVRAR